MVGRNKSLDNGADYHILIDLIPDVTTKAVALHQVYIIGLWNDLWFLIQLGEGEDFSVSQPMKIKREDVVPAPTYRNDWRPKSSRFL
jgi:hypothetical protein